MLNVEDVAGAVLRLSASVLVRPLHVEGHTEGEWILLDYVNVVVHIMQPETRKFYKLEEMWSDAVSEEFNG